MENNSYTSYQGMMAKVSTALAGMENICSDLEMEESRKTLAVSREKLERHRFSVGIMGEFKRGKSTVINSLLEQEIMPADIQPCSATMNRVTYDLRPHAELQMMDGTRRQIPVEELSSYVTKITDENASRAANVREAVVYYPCRFCQNGVEIVDTPGLNDDERMNKISEEIVPKLDAVIMVIVPGSPFGMSEAEFVRNKLMSSDLGRVIFLVNKIDTIRRLEDRKRAVDGIKSKIQATVLEKMADMYGEDSKQYRDTKMKLGNIRIFPLSALDALEGKQNGDPDMIERSGTKTFEAALTKMLTEERGALKLSTPISILQRTSIEVTKAAASRRSAMSMSVDDFNQKQRDALKEIDAMRGKKKEEERRLKERAKEVRDMLAARTARFYPQWEQRMIAAVDGFNPDPASFAKVEGQKAGSAKLQEYVTTEMNNEISGFSEKILLDLEDIIGKETLSVAQFTSAISQQIDNMNVTLTGANNILEVNDMIATGVDVLTDFIGLYGMGGVVSGFRTAGIKGAVVGGGAGLVANLAVAGILGSLSIVGLPMIMLSCVAGTIVSKMVSGTVFAPDVGKKKLAEIKNKMKENITLAVRDIQTNRHLENWIAETVDKRFDELTAAMEEECEKLLRDSERSMEEISKELAQSEAERKNVLQRLEAAEKRCMEIVRELNPVCQKVNAALEGAL